MLDSTLIADLPPFADIPTDQLSSIIKLATAHRFDKDDHVFIQGDPARSFYMLLDGCIRVVRVTPSGEQIIVRFIASGELFGIAVSLGLDNYPANAVAATDCVALAWPSTAWQTIVEQFPAFATNTYKMVGGRLQEAQDRIVEMTTERVAQRVANAVMMLVARNGRETEEGILIDFPISRQDISEMTGTTLHTVSRLMSAWEHEGLVKCGRQKVLVTATDALSQIATAER